MDYNVGKPIMSMHTGSLRNKHERLEKGMASIDKGKRETQHI